MVGWVIRLEVSPQSMEALTSRPGGLARSLPQNGRVVFQRDQWKYRRPSFANLGGRCRLAGVRCAQGDDYRVLAKKKQVSSLDLKLQSSGRRIQTEDSGINDGGGKASSRAEAAGEEGSGGSTRTNRLKTVLDALNKVSRALGVSKPKLAVLAGAASLGIGISGPVLSSLDVVPFMPETMQTVGVAFSVMVASRVYQGRPIGSMSSSPFRAIIEMVEGGPKKIAGVNVVLPDNLEGDLRDALENLVKERDEAVKKLQLTRKEAVRFAQVVAEKEALEAVAMQLAEERDSAMSEVAGLKSAVVAMTERMRSIEDLLEQEVNQLRQHNSALETISLQLANERDKALEQVRQLDEEVARSLQDKDAMEVVAAQLAEERDNALSETRELRHALTVLQGDEEAPRSSGLTPERESYIKAQALASRSKFLVVGKNSGELELEVERFVQHLVQEYGAPREWAAEYVPCLSEPMAVMGVNGGLSAGDARSVHLF